MAVERWIFAPMPTRLLCAFEAEEEPVVGVIRGVVEDERGAIRYGAARLCCVLNRPLDGAAGFTGRLAN